MTILDSNVWIAYFHERDALHHKAARLFEQSSAPFVVLEYVLAEVCTILTQHAGKDSADLFIDFSMSNRDVRLLPVAPEVFSTLVQFYRDNHNRSLSFVDMALLWFSRSYPVVTFDRKLGNAIASTIEP